MAPTIPILYRDEHVLVVDKPPGLLSVPWKGADERSLVEVLAADGIEVLPVHRLDREVSGAVLFALDETTLSGLEDLFRERALSKTYWAMAQGRVKPPNGAWKFPLLEEREGSRVSALGKKSETRYTTLDATQQLTELEIDLVTGRRNQIRVHFAHGGFPLVGERKYARGKDAAIAFKSRRVALHAWRLVFEHPRTGARVDVECPLPDDLMSLRRALR